MFYIITIKDKVVLDNSKKVKTTIIGKMILGTGATFEQLSSATYENLNVLTYAEIQSGSLEPWIYTRVYLK